MEQNLRMKILEKLNQTTTENPRDHFGMSSAGEKCTRKLQYDFHSAYNSEIPARIKRIFEIGKRLEDLVYDDLHNIGIEVFEKQKELIGLHGHVIGHIDGLAWIEGEIYLIEIKTHKASRFNAIKKAGLRVAEPGIYGQCQYYMHHMDPNKCLCIGLCKDDSRYTVEIIDYDKEYCFLIDEKYKHVMESAIISLRIGNNSKSWFECKTCFANKVCFNEVQPNKNCKTCKHSGAIEKGSWGCNLNEQQSFVQIPDEVVKTGCDYYELNTKYFRLQ